MSFAEASNTLNWGVKRGKGPIALGTEWNEQKLLRYMLDHELLDLCNSSHREMISMKLAISVLKEPEKKHFPVLESISDDEASALSVEQLRERLLWDYLTDDQEQKEKNLAENLMRCFKKERRTQAPLGKTYHPLVNFLNHNGIQIKALSTWTDKDIYNFMEFHKLITPDKKFDMMDFVIAKARYKEKKDKAELAEFFNYWLTTHNSNPGMLAHRLYSTGFSFEEDGSMPTSHSILTLLNSHNFSLDKQGAAAPKASVAKASEATSLSYLAVQGGTKEMSDLVRYYLIERKNKFSIAANQIKVTLEKYLQKGKTLESQFQEQFGHNVWEPGGLVSFSVAQKVIAIEDLPPVTAAQYLPFTDLTRYLNHALEEKNAFKFITNWTRREKDKAEFYKRLGEELHAKRIIFPRSPEQIKALYVNASKLVKEELQGELILQTLKEQANPDASGISESLKALFCLFKAENCSVNTTHGRLSKYSILIPEEADSIPTTGRPKAPGQPVRKEGDTRGQAGTSRWLKTNVEKMLNLTDLSGDFSST